MDANGITWPTIIQKPKHRLAFCVTRTDVLIIIPQSLLRACKWKVQWTLSYYCATDSVYSLLWCFYFAMSFWTWIRTVKLCCDRWGSYIASSHTGFFERTHRGLVKDLTLAVRFSVSQTDWYAVKAEVLQKNKENKKYEVHIFWKTTLK